ncbi:MAG: pseudouridine synthase [Saprospiraceae bacterium]|nr:pseudouridine synthase [Saprospiraceae bacterium]
MPFYAAYKPYGFLSQFTREAPDHKVLGDLQAFPRDVYPLGRLEMDSEGLVLLTDKKEENSRLLSPSRKHPRTFWVQVEGSITPAAIQALNSGITIHIKGKPHHCQPAKTKLIKPTDMPDRDPPVRYRATIPTSWIELRLTEGKNRQVRRMCAAIGFPVLRLIRVQIGALQLPAMEIGKVWELSRNDWEKAFR